jgi:hypothetical protein
MRDTALTRRDSILLSDTAFNFEIGPGSSMQKRKAFWTSGDINSDGSDELLIALDTLILVYNRSSKTWVPDTTELPRAVRQMVVGDIDNDGRNELIACCDSTTNGRWQESWPGMKYCVYVCRLVNKTLQMLWTDEAKLGYGEDEMPDYFWSVADFQNLGRNQLLVTRSQSDVSPTVYDLLEWSGNDKGLSRHASFFLSDTVVPASSGESDIFPYAVGRIQPFSTNSGTLVMVEFSDWDRSDSVDLDVALRQRLLRLTGNDVQSFGNVWLQDGPMGSNCDYTTIDPDGAGQGLLRVCDIWHPQPGKCFYEFRRAVTRRPQPAKEK